jgi:hypothetical protein
MACEICKAHRARDRNIGNKTYSRISFTPRYIGQGKKTKHISSSGAFFLFNISSSGAFFLFNIVRSCRLPRHTGWQQPRGVADGLSCAVGVCVVHFIHASACIVVFEVVQRHLEIALLDEVAPVIQHLEDRLPNSEELGLCKTDIARHLRED